MLMAHIWLGEHAPSCLWHTHAWQGNMPETCLHLYTAAVPNIFCQLWAQWLQNGIGHRQTTVGAGEPIPMGPEAKVAF